MKRTLKIILTLVLIIAMTINPAMSAIVIASETETSSDSSFRMEDENKDAFQKLIEYVNNKPQSRISSNNNFIIQDKPEDYSSIYQGEDLYISFYMADTYKNYYSIPLIGITNSSNEVIISGSGTNVVSKGKAAQYSEYLPTGSKNLKPGEYELTIFDVPCDENGNIVENLNDFDIPYIQTPFTIKARQNQSHTHVESAAVKENIKQATCTNEGSYDSVVYCSTCEEELSRKTYAIEALGHNYVLDSTTITNCEAGGSANYKCSRCGNIDTRSISAGQHSWNNGTIVKDVTCTTDGEKKYTCSVCGAIKSEIIVHQGHTFDLTIKEPTYDSEGYKKSVCKVCGYTETVIIDKLKPEASKQENLEKVTISSVVNTSAGLKITWRKNSSASGYQLYRSEKGSSYKKIATIKNGATVSYSDKKADTYGSKYSYKIRAFKTLDGATSYSGYSAVKSTIRIKNPTLSSIKSLGQGKVKATIKSKNAKATGYQIQCSTKTDFSSDASINTITKNSTLTKTISSLKSGKKYYFRVRAYKSSNGNKYYSAWSSKKAYTVAGINKSSVSLEVGNTSTLKMVGSSGKVTWKSSNGSVVTVNSKGKLTAKKKGSAKITAKVGKINYVCTVTVKAKKKATTVSEPKFTVDLLYGTDTHNKQGYVVFTVYNKDSKPIYFNDILTIQNADMLNANGEVYLTTIAVMELDDEPSGAFIEHNEGKYYKIESGESTVMSYGTKYHIGFSQKSFLEFGVIKDNWMFYYKYDLGTKKLTLSTKYKL